MRISISTNWNSYRHVTADGMLGEICDMGFDSVELGYALTQTQADGMHDWVNSGRIKVSSVHAYCPASIPGKTGPEIFLLADPSDYKGAQRAIKSLRKTAEFAYSVGARTVILHGGRVPIRRLVNKLEKLAEKKMLGTPKHDKVIRRIMEVRDRRAKIHLDTLCDALNDVLPYFESLGMTLGLENLPTYDGLPNEPEMQLLLDSFRTDAFAYWHDTGHAQVRHNLGLVHHAGIVTRFLDRIAGLHLHDVIAVTSDHHMPPVKGGTVDFRVFAPLLAKEVPFVLEPARGSDKVSVQGALDYLNKLWGLDGAPTTAAITPQDLTEQDKR